MTIKCLVAAGCLMRQVAMDRDIGSWEERYKQKVRWGRNFCVNQGDTIYYPT